jgi:amidase
MYRHGYDMTWLGRRPKVDEIAHLDACGQADLVRTGVVKPVELVEAAIQRIERVNGSVNAVVIPLYDKAFEIANGRPTNAPFAGVPIVLKDIQASKGDPMHAGMRMLRDLGWVEDHDAFLVSKLKAAGFVIVGKANLPELECGITTEPEAYGPTCNPWNLMHSVGGSSGGSAAAVASGMVPIAHGTDSGGSIRIPASECGLVGLKPSRGRVSLGPDLGDLGGGGTFCPYVLTKSVRDAATVLDLVSGWMPGDPYTAPPPPAPFAALTRAESSGLRIGIWVGEGAAGLPTHPECITAAQQAGRLLEDLGHHVEPSHPAAVEVGSSNIWVAAASLFAWYRKYWSTRTGREIGPADVEPLTWSFMELGQTISALQLTEFLADRDQFARAVASWWADGFDLLLTPTIAVPPPLLGECVPGEHNPLENFQPIVEAIVRFTAQFNFTGQPAISVPLYWSETGLPIGVQLVGAYGREDLLLQVAAQLEHAEPWLGRTPSVYA